MSCVRWVSRLAIWDCTWQGKVQAAMPAAAQQSCCQWSLYVFVLCGVWAMWRSGTFNSKRRATSTLGELCVDLMWTLCSLLCRLPFLILMVPIWMMEHHQLSIPSWGITWFVANQSPRVCIAFFTFALHLYVFTLTFWNEFCTKRISCRHHIFSNIFHPISKLQPLSNIRGLKLKRLPH